MNLSFFASLPTGLVCVSDPLSFPPNTSRYGRCSIGQAALCATDYQVRTTDHDGAYTDEIT